MTASPEELAVIAARIRAERKAMQAVFDAGPLGRRGTRNRALDQWVADTEDAS